MNEQDLQHGAIHQPFYRKLHRLKNRIVGKRIVRGVSIDYNVGSPFRALLTGKLPHKNQGSNSSCGGQADSYFIQIQRLIQGISEGEISAKSIYAPIAYPGGGTTVAALHTQIETGGANLESAVPSYDAYGNPLQESMIASKAWMTPALTADALTRAGYIAHDIDLNDIDAVAEAIATYGAVIFEVIGQNGNQPNNWTTAMPTPPQASNPDATWAHFMCAYDFQMYNGQKVIVALQSMGTSWGVNGIQYFGADYFTNGFIDPFTFVYEGSIKVPVEPPKAWWSKLQDWFNGWFALDSAMTTS